MNKENGNVLFLILIAVALFAALSYAVTQSTRGGGDADTETKKLEISQALNYVSSIRTAIMRMRINGVEDTDICFDAPQWGDASYSHAGCTDNENRIFHTDGGGVSWVLPPSSLNDGSPWLFNGLNVIRGSASDATADLAMLIPNITDSACKGFEEMTDFSGSRLVDGDSFNFQKFTGSYGFFAVLEGAGNQDFCIEEAGNLHFVSVLIAR